ncbi:MAG: hypothetical protein GF330_08335 [Candidatus Eisenbacteria bacterium]|nr:hypothetical protein [Candidatus Eisenbacteria bacterium]
MAADLGATIQHCTESEFHQAFLSDLLALQHDAVILSPFLSPGRANHYYAIFADLVKRGIRVQVFTKPSREIESYAREDHVRVQSSLKATGAELDERLGMHEKVAALDGEILWHGSLNILSHGSTRESMLRIPDRDLVTETLIDLRILEPPEQPHVDDALAATVRDPRCPTCSGPMHFTADAALWICDRPACSGVRYPAPDEQVPGEAAPKRMVAEADPRDAQPGPGEEPPSEPEAAKASPAGHDHDHDPALDPLHLLCPLCQSAMRIRRGATVTIVCSDPDCDFAFDPRLTRWLLRSLRRRRSV